MAAEILSENVLDSLHEEVGGSRPSAPDEIDKASSDAFASADLALSHTTRAWPHPPGESIRKSRAKYDLHGKYSKQTPL
jgi:hypothetical protein